jgi:hypothetical protein
MWRERRVLPGGGGVSGEGARAEELQGYAQEGVGCGAD